MKNKGFIKVMLLSASLVSLCSNVLAQAGTVIAEAEDNGIRGIIFENTHRATQTKTIGFRAELINSNEAFVNSPRSRGRFDVLRLGFNGVRVHKTKAALNANLTKATASNILEASFVTNLNKMVLRINPQVRGSDGVVAKRSATFHFDVPSFSNSRLNALNKPYNSPFQATEITISNANVVYNKEKKRIGITASIKGALKYAAWYIQNLVTACERSTTIGTTRDCNAYVNEMLAADRTAACSVQLGFTPIENGVIGTANLEPKTGYENALSSKVVRLMSQSASGQPMCADDVERRAIFIINANPDFNGAGKSDTDGIIASDYFQDGVANYTLIPSARIPDPFYNGIDRGTLARGDSKSLNLPMPAEFQSE